MAATLPRFSRGLKLTRLAVFVMLAQLVLAIVMTVKALGASSASDVQDALKWTEYFFLANIGAMVAMLVGVVGAIPELRRARMNTRSLLVAAAGFAVAAAVLGWTYHVVNRFIEILMNPDGSFEDLVSAAGDLKNAKYFVIVKDLAYAIGLISLIGMIERSAQHNDQLALRDDARSISRMLIVMLVADLFYQLTYGSGSAGPIGTIGSLLVGGYWIYCHIRLQRFLFNAAYFMNEPHDLPVATLVVRSGDDWSADKPAARPSAPAVKPAAPARIEPVADRPSAPVVLPPRPEVTTPRAYSEGEAATGEQPKFLR